MRVAQKFDDFLQIFLGFINARDIFKGDAPVGLGQELGLGLAKAHGFGAAALHLARHKHPEADQSQNGKGIAQNIHKPGAALGWGFGRDRNILGI